MKTPKSTPKKTDKEVFSLLDAWDGDEWLDLPRLDRDTRIGSEYDRSQSTVRLPDWIMEKLDQMA